MYTRLGAMAMSSGHEGAGEGLEAGEWQTKGPVLEIKPSAHSPSWRPNVCLAMALGGEVEVSQVREGHTDE